MCVANFTYRFYDIFYDIIITDKNEKQTKNTLRDIFHLRKYNISTQYSSNICF